MGPEIWTGVGTNPRLCPRFCVCSLEVVLGLRDVAAGGAPGRADDASLAFLLCENDRGGGPGSDVEALLGFLATEAPGPVGRTLEALLVFLAIEARGPEGRVFLTAEFSETGGGVRCGCVAGTGCGGCCGGEGGGGKYNGDVELRDGGVYSGGM